MTPANHRACAFSPCRQRRGLGCGYTHMKLRSLALAVGFSGLLVSQIMPGEILLTAHHLSVTLPESWKQIPEQRPGLLVRAESDAGRLRFILTKPPVKATGDVKDAEFQMGVKRS